MQDFEIGEAQNTYCSLCGDREGDFSFKSLSFTKISDHQILNSIRPVCKACINEYEALLKNRAQMSMHYDASRGLYYLNKILTSIK